MPQWRLSGRTSLPVSSTLIPDLVIVRTIYPHIASARDTNYLYYSLPAADHPAKRAKTTSTASDKVRIGPSKRVRGRLSELPSMPLDILYEVRDISLIQYQVNQSWTGVAPGTKIFGHLPPSGLLSLSRVSKAFRQLLMSRSSLFLWKTSYSLIPDVPTCPEDMSEPAWAHLLFGGAYCYVRWLSHVKLFSLK
jgi:F-box domain